MTDPVPTTEVIEARTGQATVQVRETAPCANCGKDTPALNWYHREHQVTCKACTARGKKAHERVKAMHQVFFEMREGQTGWLPAGAEKKLARKYPEITAVIDEVLGNLGVSASFVWIDRTGRLRASSTMEYHVPYYDVARCDTQWNGCNHWLGTEARDTALDAIFRALDKAAYGTDWLAFATGNFGYERYGGDADAACGFDRYG